MEIHSNVSLKAYNTFGIEVRAKKFAAFENADQLREILSDPQVNNLPVLILGGGSNILFTKDFDGLVLKNEVKGIEKLQEDEESYLIRAGSGENWHEFVLTCIRNGWAGLENLSLIPGNVGASPMQNIGAYGVEVKDRFHSLKAFNLSSFETENFDGPACEFGYRDSVFKQRFKGKYIILSVTFRLLKKPELNTSYGAIEGELNSLGIKEPTIASVSEAVIRIRNSKLPNPAVLGNAGSFFKNPVISREKYLELVEKYPSMPFYPAGSESYKVAAGWLIDQCGWKGVRKGNCGVHAKQALVLVNYGGATGAEVYRLSEEIETDVFNRYGIRLEREVNIL
jgi:UDP-N-acetylmuramate dehydrogenase